MTDATRDPIAELLRKGRLAQDQSEEDVDWSRRPRRPIWMSSNAAIWAVSQLRHGELRTAAMCRAVAPSVDGRTAAEFLDTQALDEMRHSRLYMRYLEKLNTASLKPPAGARDRAYEEARGWRGAPEAILLAYSVILEGEALRIQRSAETWLPCPVFRDLSAIVARDEARHVAFGKHYLRTRLPVLAQSERLRMYVWARDLWFDAARGVTNEITPPLLRASGLGAERWLATKWRERMADLQAAGLFTAEERPMFEAA
ncbi:MAG: diiron oxygenase [Pseudomonadota bacterium]